MAEDSMAKTERNQVEKLKILEKKKRDFQIMKLIAAPGEAIQERVEEHLSSENVYTYILLVDGLMK